MQKRERLVTKTALLFFIKLFYLDGTILLKGDFHSVLDIIEKFAAEAVNNRKRRPFKPSGQ